MAPSTVVFLEHGTRQMHFGGVTINPTGTWAVQQARNLALTPGRRFADIRFLIRDRGPDLTAWFDRQQIRRRPVLSGLLNECTHAA